MSGNASLWMAMLMLMPMLILMPMLMLMPMLILMPMLMLILMLYRHGRRGHLAWVGALLLTLVAGTSTAHAQNKKQVSVSASSDIYAGLPFTLMVSARGFAEEPTPELTDFEIPGCTVTFVGVTPNVSTSISIFNGRRTESRTVEFVYRYRVLPEKPGNYRLPAITVTQGSDSASSSPAAFKASDVATTRDMRVTLTLPERAVTVGETFDVTLDWYLRKNPQDHEFSVPLFDAVDWVDVHQPQLSPIRRRNDALTFSAGDRELALPYTQSDEVVDGVKYTRLRFVVSMTPIKAGTLALPATRVVAGLQVGSARDAFGFPVARTQLFKAEDRPHTLEIQPLPMTGRPASFANAIGTAYSIQVRAERTVVELGEPLELEITIRGDGRLEGLSLPRLDTADGLSPEQFTVPDTLPAGEIVDLGNDSSGEPIKGKRFRVTARIKSPDVTGVPPIAFSFYNPARKQYETVKSEPIALSVANRGVVGASQVVRANSGSAGSDSSTTGGQAAGTSTGALLASLVGADLSLSATAETMTRPWAVTGLGWAIYLFYALPLAFLLFRIWQLGTRARREDRGEVRKSLRAARRAIDDATTTPARDAGPRVIAALRALARSTGRERLQDDVIARLENESYRPDAGERPMDRELTDAARKLADRLADEGRSAKNTAKAGAGVGVGAALLSTVLLSAQPARAQTPIDPGGAPADPLAAAQPTTIDAARAAYQDALSQPERDARTAGFARAERMFRELVERTPDSPALLTDWGNAALGAQELGRATLAYRRAMALHPRQDRAKRNLSWVRDRLPDWLPRPETRTMGDSLFFWHHSLTRHERQLIAGISFAFAVLLLVPWGRRQRLLRRLALLPAVIWVAMFASVLLDQPPVDDAVVLRDDIPMLSANNPGAPRVLARPLPAGAEVTIRETRDPWTRIALADGTEGWVQTSAIERVLP